MTVIYQIRRGALPPQPYSETQLRDAGATAIVVEGAISLSGQETRDYYAPSADGVGYVPMPRGSSC